MKLPAALPRIIGARPNVGDGWQADMRGPRLEVL